MVPSHAIVDFVSCVALAGEAGKVDESIQRLAAVEALKAEKADKEVRPRAWLRSFYSCFV